MDGSQAGCWYLHAAACSSVNPACSQHDFAIGLTANADHGIRHRSIRHLPAVLLVEWERCRTGESIQRE